ncbi:hypothetical protein B4147_5226 [Bacillus wiedmannii]|uniref:Uncharacterized protein n=1 Tax=Bacillus wiedmannii TaxID=1890302 RepID=A0A0G8C884_9BACI|nr:hypothetical protein B4147_5226 [Bacillus wiedmannii]
MFKKGKLYGIFNEFLFVFSSKNIELHAFQFEYFWYFFT